MGLTSAGILARSVARIRDFVRVDSESIEINGMDRAFNLLD
jgi:hypothetical protein